MISGSILKNTDPWLKFLISLKKTHSLDLTVGFCKYSMKIRTCIRKWRRNWESAICKLNNFWLVRYLAKNASKSSISSWLFSFLCLTPFSIGWSVVPLMWFKSPFSKKNRSFGVFRWKNWVVLKGWVRNWWDSKSWILILCIVGIK